jgi:hypothetical protein
MIAGQNAKIEGQNAMIWGRNFMIGGQNAKIDGQNAKIEAATTCKGLDLMQGERGTVASPTASLSTKMSHAAATICDQGGGVEEHGRRTSLCFEGLGRAPIGSFFSPCHNSMIER